MNYSFSALLILASLLVLPASSPVEAGLVISSDSAKSLCACGPRDKQDDDDKQIEENS